MSCPKCGCKETYQFDGDGDDCSQPDDRLERCAACGHVFDIDDGVIGDDDPLLDYGMEQHYTGGF